MVDSMFTPAFAELVRMLVAMRVKAGLTQRQLAERLGREQNYVGRIETGQRRLDLVELVRYCIACDVDAAKQIQRLISRVSPLISHNE